MRCLPLPLCHFLCFRLCLYFHCVMSSSLASPHPLSAHPSLVVLPDYQHVAIPFIAASSICFSFSSSSRSSWFLRLFLHQSLPLFFLFLLSFFSAPLFLHSYSVSLLFPSPIIYPIIFNPSYHFFFICLSYLSPPHHFSLCNFPSHSQLLFPFTLIFPLGSLPLQSPHMPIIPPTTCRHNMIFTGSLLYAHRLSLSNPHLSSHFLSSSISTYSFSFQGFLCSHPPSPYLFSSFVYHCVIFWPFFTCVNLITAFKHQTSFILSSLFFLILSPCCSSFWLYLTLVSCFPIAELWFLYILIEMEYAQ